MIKISNGIREVRVDGTPESYFRLYTKCWDNNPESHPDIEEVVETLENNEIVYYPNGISTIQPLSVQLQKDIIHNPRSVRLPKLIPT